MFSACAGMIVLPPGCSGSQRVTSKIIPAWQEETCFPRSQTACLPLTSAILEV